MVESVASVTLLQVRDSVARWLYQAATGYSALSSDQKLNTDLLIDRGYRLYMAPPVLPGERLAHTWSWIRPETTLTVAAAVPSAKATTAMASTTAIVDTDATFHTGWDTQSSNAVHELIGKTVTATDVSTSTTYTSTVSSVTDANTLVVADTWNSALSSTDDTYSIEGDGDWNLPDDHGGIIGNLTFDATTIYPPVKQTSEQRIRTLRQDSFVDQTQRPYLFAVRPRLAAIAVGTTAGTATTRWEVMFWPKPDEAFTFHYRYVKMFEDITSDTHNFPGGLRNAECILAACMAVAERFADPTTPVSGKQWEYFIEVLRGAVSLDRSEMTADNLGPNLDRSDHRFHLHIHESSSAPTYLGVEYPT